MKIFLKLQFRQNFSHDWYKITPDLFKNKFYGPTSRDRIHVKIALD
jgi:hypothetical protein